MMKLLLFKSISLSVKPMTGFLLLLTLVDFMFEMSKFMLNVNMHMHVIVKWKNILNSLWNKILIREVKLGQNQLRHISRRMVRNIYDYKIRE